MREIEVKARIKDLGETRKKLEKMGCTFSEPLDQKDIIFLHKSPDLRTMEKGKVILRIRNSSGAIILTLKKQCENELDNIEEEVVVESQEKMERILKYMDYEEVIRVNKVRQKTFYKDMEICVDRVEGLGDFIEVEKMTDDKQEGELQGKLFEFLESLGVKKEDQVFKGYDSLLYDKKHNEN